MIIFFYGENDFTISQKTKGLQEKFIREVDSSGQNIFSFDGEKINLNELTNQISNGSLFSNKKMILISDLIKNKQKNILKSLLEYLQKNKSSDSDDIIIFIEKNIKEKNNSLLKISAGKESVLNKEEKEFYNFLRNQKFTQEFKNFTSFELNNFVKKELATFNLKIDNKESQLLLAISGNDPWNLYNEIKKIANFKLGQNQGDKILSEDIEKISSGVFSENIFSFTDAVSARNLNLASKILEEQYVAGSEPVYILSMLLRQFKILLQIRELLDLNYNTAKIISSLKLHPFVINKGINQAKNFESKKLKKIINILAETELQNRQGSPNVKAIINLLVATI